MYENLDESICEYYIQGYRKVEKRIVEIFDLTNNNAMQMSPENFVKELYALLIVEGSETYKDLFLNTRKDEAIIEYWQQALNLFSILPKDQHQVFFEIIRQISIDTTATLLAVLDGVTYVEGAAENFTLSYGENETKRVLSGDLSEQFLLEVEVNSKKSA